MIDTTNTKTAETIRTQARQFLGLAALGALAIGSSACSPARAADAAGAETTVQASTTEQASPIVQASTTEPTTDGDRTTSSETDVEVATPEVEVIETSPGAEAEVSEVAEESGGDDERVAAPVRDLSGTGEGENVYVDDAGIRRNAGTDEPECPQPAPANGQDVHGDFIQFDGSTGLPLCDADGNFLTMPAGHEDHDPFQDRSDGDAAPDAQDEVTDASELFYVDDLGALRMTGTDEPVCLQALPADGLDADGNSILIDGRFGLPLCDVDGNFLTMPAEHEDHGA